MDLVRFIESFDSLGDSKHLTEELIITANFALQEVATKLLKSKIGERLIFELHEPECKKVPTDFTFMATQGIALEEVATIVNIPLFSEYFQKILEPGVLYKLKFATSFSHLKKILKNENVERAKTILIFNGVHRSRIKDLQQDEETAVLFAGWIHADRVRLYELKSAALMLELKKRVKLSLN